MPHNPDRDIRLLLADVDGTLVDSDKRLTDRAIRAVGALRDAGIRFAVTSGRPPRGMEMLVKPLGLDTPIAAFNGGLIVDDDMSVIEQRTITDDLVLPIAHAISERDLDVWIYRGRDWFVPDLKGAHVAKEKATVRFAPKKMKSVEDVATDVAKIVGVSDDHAAVERAAREVHERFGDHVTAAPSQPYYLDVTHPLANKGAVADWLADRYDLDGLQIATIGDQPNDIKMFNRSGLAIAMGNADPQVHRAAQESSDSDDDDGFAKAVEEFLLGDG